MLALLLLILLLALVCYIAVRLGAPPLIVGCVFLVVVVLLLVGTDFNTALLVR